MFMIMAGCGVGLKGTFLKFDYCLRNSGTCMVVQTFRFATFFARPYSRHAINIERWLPFFQDDMRTLKTIIFLLTTLTVWGQQTR